MTVIRRIFQRNAVGIAILAVSVQLAIAQDEHQQKTNLQGYGYAGIGAVIADGEGDGISQTGGGLEWVFPRGLGLSADIGYMFDTGAFSSGFGTFSPGVLYRRSRGKLDGFVTGGYTLGFGTEGGERIDMVHFGGGATYWFSHRVGLRIEARDHVTTKYENLNYFVFRVGIAGR